MELKEFIINTVSDILDAVNELQEENKTNAVINPKDVTGNCSLVTAYKSSSIKSNARLTEVEFNVQLCESEEKCTGRGIGVMLNGIGVKLGNDRSNSNNAITSIKFVIPLLLPMKN